jgi:hypothetical protein
MPTQRRRTQQSPNTASTAEEDQGTETTNSLIINDNDGKNAKNERSKWRPTTEELVIPLRLFEPDRAVTVNDAVQYATLCRKDVNINDKKAIGKLQTTIEDMKHTIKGCLQT